MRKTPAATPAAIACGVAVSRSTRLMKYWNDRPNDLLGQSAVRNRSKIPFGSSATKQHDRVRISLFLCQLLSQPDNKFSQNAFHTLPVTLPYQACQMQPRRTGKGATDFNTLKPSSARG
jgi:hypothetical protein